MVLDDAKDGSKMNNQTEVHPELIAELEGAYETIKELKSLLQKSWAENESISELLRSQVDCMSDMSEQVEKLRSRIEALENGSGGETHDTVEFVPGDLVIVAKSPIDTEVKEGSRGGVVSVDNDPDWPVVVDLWLFEDGRVRKKRRRFAKEWLLKVK